jgi:DNA-directed RNA polymerase I subunit RPA1
VYNELRKLWNNEQDLVRVMFGNDCHANSFTMFFLNAVFVPPSRFRPESKLGEEKYLHDHTAILARILEANNDIKGMLIKQFNDKDRELDRNRFQVQKDLTHTKMIEFKKTQFYSQALRRLKGQSEFINKWLELQDSINCFIDSSKSSRMQDRDFKGVRQIL